MTHLQLGDSAPDFAITNQSGELIKLSDFSDKKLRKVKDL